MHSVGGVKPDGSHWKLTQNTAVSYQLTLNGMHEGQIRGAAPGAFEAVEKPDEGRYRSKPEIFTRPHRLHALVVG